MLAPASFTPGIVAASGPRKRLPPPGSPHSKKLELPWRWRVQTHAKIQLLSNISGTKMALRPHPKPKKRLRRPGSPHSKQSILAPGAPPTAKYRPQLLSNISGTKMALARQPKKAACPRQVHPIARSLSPRSLRPYNWMPDLNSSVTPLDQNGITPHPPSPWQMDPHVLPWPGSCRNHLK